MQRHGITIDSMGNDELGREHSGSDGEEDQLLIWN